MPAIRQILRTPLLLTLLVAFVAGCDATSEEGTSTFYGTVVDGATDEPIEAATVHVVGTSQTTSTDASGFFSLVVEADSTGDLIPLQVFARGYHEVTKQVPAVVDGEVPIPDIELRARTTNDGGSGGNDGGTDNGGVDEGADGPSGPASSITLVARSSEAIGVTEAGADETATLTFVVLDGLGNPVDAEHAVDLRFAIGNGPGGGEYLTPEAARTNADGRAQTTVTAGTRAGTVQVVASFTMDGREVRSQPVTITITGGLPDADHFSIAQQYRNFPGYARYGVTNTITAYVGDKYGNPVQPGTAVYFTTDGGLIGGSGVTNAQGSASVELVSAAPMPSNAIECSEPVDPSGYARVTARTSNENNVTIEAVTTILFSDEAELDLVTPGLEMGAFDYVVSDRFGHPLAPGTTISVVADGINVEAIGDMNVTLGDYLCPGPGRTEFRFSVVQGDEIGEDDLPLPPALETITIKVQGPNGDIQLTRSALGGRGAGAVRYEDVIERDF